MAYYDLLEKLGFKFTTSIPKGPAYIMKDGRFLDITGSMNIIAPDMNLKATHTMIDQFLIEKGYIPESAEVNRVLCSSDGAIRVNDGSGLMGEILIGLPTTRPTEIQFSKLEDWLYGIMSKGHVSVGNDNSNYVFKVYDFNEYLPEDIIKRIKEYYSSGKLRDSLFKKSK